MIAMHSTSLQHACGITCCVRVQPTSQSQETGALPVIRAATDPSLTGQGFKYFGPFYKGPLNANIGNEGTVLRLTVVMNVMYVCNHQLCTMYVKVWLLQS